MENKEVILLGWQKDMLSAMEKGGAIENWNRLPRAYGKKYFKRFLVRSHPELYIKYFIGE